MGTDVHLLDVQSRRHVGDKNFSQRIDMVNRVDRVHVMSIRPASAPHQSSSHHGVSVRDGLVGDEPLLLPVAVPLTTNLWQTICVAHSSSNPPRVAHAAILVRRAFVVPSFLADVSETCARWVDRARFDVTPFDSGSRHEDFRGHVDVPLPVDGTALSAFDNSRADPSFWILASTSDADASASLSASLVRRSFGFDLGWTEPHQLVCGARHDRVGVVFA